MTNSDAVVIERTFDAPAELIWRMWTVPEHFKAWYGPNGATIPVANLDVRVGGKRHICMEMRTPNGPMTMWFAGEHLEVVESVRLAYTEAISDESGTMPPPSGESATEAGGTTEVRVELAALDGGTKMVMTHLGVPSDSPGAMGWNMAFEKLATYVETEAA